VNRLAFWFANAPKSAAKAEVHQAPRAAEGLVTDKPREDESRELDGARLGEHGLTIEGCDLPSVLQLAQLRLRLGFSALPREQRLVTGSPAEQCLPSAPSRRPGAAPHSRQ
jgi:hypothetical protein